MITSYRPVVNIDDLRLEPFKRGVSYESLDCGISELLGLTQIGAVLTEVPPGKSACPFHVHHVEEEMFFILEGIGEYRFGNEVHAVKAGDILAAPRGGKEFAHKLTNTGTDRLKYLAVSSKADTEICEYPDSGKFMVRKTSQSEGSPKFRFVGRFEDEKDYWDGEEGS